MFALVSTNRLLDGSSRDRDVIFVFFHLENTSQFQLWKSAYVAGVILKEDGAFEVQTSPTCAGGVKKRKNSNRGFGPSNN